MRRDKVDEGCRQIPVKLFCCPGDRQGCRERGVLAILQLCGMSNSTLVAVLYFLPLRRPMRVPLAFRYSLGCIDGYPEVVDRTEFHRFSANILARIRPTPSFRARTPPASAATGSMS